MALHNMPQGASGADIKPRIEFDARAGRWSRVDRTQGTEGWQSDKTELAIGAMMIMDFATIEVGWIDFAGKSGPDFRMVANGQEVGAKPTDMHKAGFRLAILLPKEQEARTFASSAKAVIGVIDELHTQAEVLGQAGMVPVMRVTGTRLIETKGPQGINRNYAPLLDFAKWVPRPAALGAAPVVAKPVVAKPGAPALHRATPVQSLAAPVGGGPIDDEIPFAAEWR